MENAHIRMLAVSGTSQQVMTHKLSVVLRCTTSYGQELLSPEEVKQFYSSYNVVRHFM